MKNDPFLEALKKTVAVCYMIHAAIFALAAFLTAPGGHGIVGLVNWPVLALAAVYGAVGAFLWIYLTREKPIAIATGTALDRLGAIYGLTRRTRKTFTLPFATIRVMERDKDSRRRIARAVTRHPQEIGTYIFTQARKGAPW